MYRLKPRANGQLKRQNEIDPLLERIRTMGVTALYDSLMGVITDLHDKTRPTTLLVLTDGLDNASKHTLEDVMNEASKWPAVVLDIVHIDETMETVPKEFTSLARAYKGTAKSVKITAIAETLATFVIDTQ